MHKEWIEECKEIQDPRVLWNYLKHKIQYKTIIVHSKRKAKERRAKLLNLENRLKECKNRCNEYPTADNWNDLEILQAEYDHHYEYKAQGTTLRSTVNWYKQGEKSNTGKCFLNLEKENRWVRTNLLSRP